ncbi:hypothetical protein ULG90_06335 [Halopseudomonas pachastrellae]|nr:hypothetical protein ULG90_06335 [Halopseudomonas pachastrellae]
MILTLQDGTEIDAGVIDRPWGTILGDITQQLDLMEQLGLKVNQDTYSTFVTATNNALGDRYTKSESDARYDAALRQDLANSTDPAKGAKIIGWNEANVSDYLDAGWYTPPDLDLTGVTDESSVVLAALNKYKRVRLPGTPGGSIKLDIVIPSGCSLFGAGQQAFDRSALTWSGNGTLVKGRIAATGSKSSAFGMMSIDSFALGINAVQGTSDTTEYIYVGKVTTRANNHGHLWEQNSIHADGRNGGNIVVTDCIHYGGPNGLSARCGMSHSPLFLRTT